MGLFELLKAIFSKNSYDEEKDRFTLLDLPDNKDEDLDEIDKEVIDMGFIEDDDE